MTHVALPRQEYGTIVKEESIQSPTLDSDLVLPVVVETDLPVLRRPALVQHLFRPAPCPMEVFAFTSAELEKWRGTFGPIVTQAFTTGKTLYDRPTGGTGRAVA